MSLISSFSSVAGGATSPVRIFAKAGPTVQITSSNMNLAYGSTATLTFSLSSAPGANTFTQSDISVTNGSLSGFTAVDSKTYTATLAPNGNFSGNVNISIAAGAFNDVSAIGNNPSSLQIPAATYPPITFNGALYKTTDRTLLLTGANFSSMLGAGDVTGVTDIKDRFDWSKLSYDINGDSTTTDVGFTLADISSAIVNTASNTLVIKLTSEKAASLEATANFGGVTLDTVDITTGFSRDSAGNASATDGIANAQLPTVISLGSFGKMIAPATVDGGSRYYYFDINGDDSVGMGWVFDRFNLNSQGLNINGLRSPSYYRTDETFRFAYFDFTTNNFDTLNLANSILLAIPIMGASSPPATNGILQVNPTSYSGNQMNPYYDGAVAIYDAFTNSTVSTGKPTGWQGSVIFTATQNISAGLMVMQLDNGYMVNNANALYWAAPLAFQVN